MTRQAILAIVIGAIVVLGAAAAILYSKTNQEPSEEAAVATQEELTPEKGMMAESLVDLLKNQENVRCTFNNSSEAGDTSGTVYVSGENMRGDFDLTTEDGSESTHVIRSGDTFYMWGDSLKTGIKMVMNIQDWAESAQKAQPTGAPQALDPNAQVDFKCSAWTVDSGLFNAPSDIKFVSFQGMMAPTGTMTDETQNSDSTTETNSQDQCSICSALTGDARNVCLKQFNCQ